MNINVIDLRDQCMHCILPDMEKTFISTDGTLHSSRMKCRDWVRTVITIKRMENPFHLKNDLELIPDEND